MTIKTYRRQRPLHSQTILENKCVFCLISRFINLKLLRPFGFDASIGKKATKSKQRLKKTNHEPTGAASVSTVAYASLEKGLQGRGQAHRKMRPHFSTAKTISKQIIVLKMKRKIKN